MIIYMSFKVIVQKFICKEINTDRMENQEMNPDIVQQYKIIKKRRNLYKCFKRSVHLITRKPEE